MAVLNIRNLSNSVHKRLRIRAARHGRSMEAEARAILTEVCGGKEIEYTAENLPGLIAELYRGTTPRNTVEDLISERRKEAHREK
jgi:plasmid stability protein